MSNEAFAEPGNTVVNFVFTNNNGDAVFSISDPDLLDKDTSLPSGIIALDCSIFQAVTISQFSFPLTITINDCQDPSDETEWLLEFDGTTGTATCTQGSCLPVNGPPIGGELIPVDNVSLVLAYGLVNSWWMAPIGIGIGLGIYLVKRKF